MYKGGSRGVHWMRMLGTLDIASTMGVWIQWNGNSGMVEWWNGGMYFFSLWLSFQFACFYFLGNLFLCVCVFVANFNSTTFT